MSDSYGTSYPGHPGFIPLPSRLFRSTSADRAHRQAGTITSNPPLSSGGLHLSRLVTMMMVVLALTFGAVYKLTDTTGVNAFWPELMLAFGQLAFLGATYHAASVRRHFGAVIRTFCYLTAGWFILLAILNGFDPNYAVGLLFILPGLGVAYSVTARHILPLALFFILSVAVASVACLLAAGTGAASLLFIASLICISFVTLFVSVGWLDAQKRYLASEERYRAVVERASDGIYQVDAISHVILDANPAFCRLVGIPLSELRGMRVDRLVASTAPGLPAAAGQPEGGRRGVASECRLQCADGSVVCVELKVDRIPHDTGDILSVVVHDIQSRKDYEQRLLKAKESAEEIAGFKSALLANMSHEIRTPLCSILGWTAVLTDELPDRHKEIVALIEQSGKRLHRTLDSVIELAHLQANVTELSPILMDLNAEVATVVAPLRDRAESKGIDLRVEHAPGPLWAELDATCLRRILGHIVDNAIKFTEQGHITVSLRQAADEILIAVKDTGVGISREFLPSVFDEFKQESAGLSREHEGNGLGLAISRRLADLIDGKIYVTSKRGGGSTFTVHVPAASARTSRKRTKAA